MKELILAKIYKALFNEDFNKSSFEMRLKMQKAIYLLQEKGYSIDNYGFNWYIHGPYSQSLMNDILKFDFNKCNYENVNFTSDFNSFSEILNDLFNKHQEYTSKNWIECLGSLLYIKKYMLCQDSSDDDVINFLMERKPHLDNESLNGEALKSIKNIYNI